MSRRALAILALLLVPSLLPAQGALPMGNPAAGTLGDGGTPTRYRFTASGPGVLTVAVGGTEDLMLAVLDEDGQPVPEGNADRDLNGNMGAELISVVLYYGGTYFVEVRGNGLETAARFAIGGGFVAMPAFARAPDPDRRPSQARVLAVGAAHQDELNPGAGDLWDWYAVKATEAMTVVVVTRMEEGVEGDLILEAYLGTDYSEPTTQSDQDLQGHTGNESLTIDVKAGETVYIKVKSLSDSGDATPYRLSIGKVP